MKKLISIISAIAIAVCTIPSLSMSVFAAERTCEINGVTWGFRLLPGSAALQSVSGSVKNLVMPEYVEVSGTQYRLASIDNRALQNNTGVESFKFNSICTDIGDYAFSGCSNLKSVTFSSSVATIGMRAFEKTALETVTLGVVTRSIGEYAFASCTKLTTFTAGYGLTSIGDYALQGCTALKKISLNRALTDIGEKSMGYNSATVKNENVYFLTARDSAGSKYAQDNGFTCKYNIALLNIPLIRDRKYTGKAFTPIVTLTDSGYTLKNGSDYTIAYSKNINPGNAVVKITGIGDYEGTVSATFYIKPIVGTVKKVKASVKKSRLTVKWKKLSDVTGYQIQYAKKKSFAGKKSVKVKNASKKRINKKLKSGKYFIRVRAYKRIGGRTNYGSWSNVVKKKVR